jgi:hypothetical protein
MMHAYFSCFISLGISFSLLIAPLPLSALAQPLSVLEIEIINRNIDLSYVYLGEKLENIVSQLSKLDDFHNSLLHDLNNHIKNGYRIGEYNAVIEGLEYAKHIIQKNKTLNYIEAQKLMNDLNEIIHQVISRKLVIDSKNMNSFQQSASLPSYLQEFNSNEIINSSLTRQLIGLAPARVVSTMNIGSSPAGLLTIDGVTLNPNDRVLLVGQTNPIENGVWLAQSSSWTRPADFAIGDMPDQAYVLISSGSVNAGSSWLCTTPTAVINTDPIAFTLFAYPEVLLGDVTGPSTATIVALVSGQTAANVASATSTALAATNLNTANTIVKRNASGSFAAQVVSVVDVVASGNLVLSTEPSTSTAGNIRKGSSTFIHDAGTNNMFAGIDSGSLTTSGTGQNSGFGVQALDEITTGSKNTAVGFNAAGSTTIGTSNTAVGANALAIGVFANQNVAIGSGALQNHTSGPSVAVGYLAMNADTASSQNTAVGWSALTTNTTGQFNTAIGFSSLFDNTTGVSNTAVGNNSLLNNTIGSFNIAVGSSSLAANTTGVSNTAVGWHAIASNVVGSNNTGIGYNALANNLEDRNTAVGSNSLMANTFGTGNTAIGASSLAANTIGFENTAVGSQALVSNTTGFFNTALGEGTLFTNTIGHQNTAVGWEALVNCTTGNNNTAIGSGALINIDTGSNNVAVGLGAGNGLYSGNGNIYINAFPASGAESNTIRIGTSQKTCVIQGIRGATAAGGIAVLVGATGILGTTTSSIKFKDNVEDMNNASEGIYKLRPVIFTYKEDEVQTPQYGLIAEEVDKTFPDLVAKDTNNEPYSVQYHVLPVLLLNEMKKQQVTINAQQSAIKNLGTTVDKQDEVIENLTLTIESMSTAINSLQSQLLQFVERVKTIENKA